MHGTVARAHEAEGRADLALPLAEEALKIYERLQHKDLAEVRELVERLQKTEDSRQSAESREQEAGSERQCGRCLLPCAFCLLSSAHGA